MLSRCFLDFSVGVGVLSKEESDLLLFLFGHIARYRNVLHTIPMTYVTLNRKCELGLHVVSNKLIFALGIQKGWVFGYCKPPLLP